MANRFYEFGPFRIDRLNHVLLKDGEEVSLQPKLFDTLLVLVEGRQRVLSKDELMSQLWPDTVVEEANLSQNIYLLRKVLGDGVNGDSYIQTMPKRGYRFIATVSEIADPAADTTTPGVLPLTGVHTKRRQRFKAVVLVLCLIGLSIVAYLYFHERNNSTTTPIKSLAVLPFKSLASNAEDETLRFGLTETLITRLNALRKIPVRSSSAVRKFSGSDRDPLRAGSALNVDAVLDTNIQKSGNQIRITMTLFRVSDGSPLWTRTIDRQNGDLFALENSVAEEVASALLPELNGNEKSQIAKRYTDNSEAYLLYMSGRSHWNKTTDDDLVKAISYYNRAIEKDRNYALAYAGLADAYSSLAADSLFPKDQAIASAKQAAMTALQLDDSLAEAHVSLGRLKAYSDWDWVGAEVELKRAIELDPNSSLAHEEYALLLNYVGRPEESIVEALKARELDPPSQLANFSVAWSHICARKFDEAIAQSRQVSATFPTAHYWIGVAYLGKGMNQEAIAELESVKDLLVAKSFLGYAYGVSGRTQEAQDVLAEFKQLSSKRPISPYYLALVYAGLGKKDQAFTLLEAAYKEHSRPLGGLKSTPAWDRLRSDPRFGDLLRRIGLQN